MLGVLLRLGTAQCALTLSTALTWGSWSSEITLLRVFSINPFRNVVLTHTHSHLHSTRTHADTHILSHLIFSSHTTYQMDPHSSQTCARNTGTHTRTHTRSHSHPTRNSQLYVGFVVRRAPSTRAAKTTCPPFILILFSRSSDWAAETFANLRTPL